jgi:GAF domain-containing protein
MYRGRWAYVLPYERAMVLASQDEPADDQLPTVGSEPLVPILRVEDGQMDPMALATWHQALSNTLSVEVPHDLLALWLYPSQGGVVLLGPTELAADDLAVPLPSPQLRPEQLGLVEEIVVDAGYKSAICLPIRFGKRDVALLLVADLQPDRYGAAERVLLQCVAHRVAPMLGRIARQWAPAEGSSSRQQERIAGLLEAVAEANRDAGTAQRFLLGVSRGLAPLLPHDHIELLIQDTGGEKYYRLGEHAGGPIWADPSLVISRVHLDITAIFDSHSRLLVPDTYEDERWPRGFFTASEPTGGDMRAVLGAQISIAGGLIAYLLVGSVGPEIYGSEDLELLGLLAGLIAPQLGGFMRSAPQPQPQPSTAEPATVEPTLATRLIGEESAALLPFDTLTIALRLTEGDRVVLIEPGEQRQLTELPAAPVAGTPLERVLHGKVSSSLAQSPDDSRLIVPLRVAGEIHGALILSAGSLTSLEECHLGPAQRLADMIAPHLELLRCAAQSGQSVAPERRAEKPGRNKGRALPAVPPRRG